jgi:N-acetylneuraminate synthase/sialic acid synthase
LAQEKGRTLVIDGVRISDDTDCWVIAEIGHNHQGKLDQCKELFLRAKQCGAHAVKLQKRDNRSLFTRAAYDRPYDNENSFGKTYGEHRERLEFDREQYLELKKYAAELGITFFSTAFDVKSADFLAELDMPAYKIASGDLRNIPLLQHVARIGRPMIVSTGGGTMEDVRRAYDAIMPINRQLAILQCTAGYPPAWDELNLRVIETFRNEFRDIVIGLSSHDSGIAMGPVAYMLGARVIEKHFTLNRAMKGTDHAFSLESPGLRRLCRDLQRTRLALGDGVKRTYDSERDPLVKMGKKLVAARALERGSVLREADIAVKSPGDALPPFRLSEVVGRRLSRSLAEDENISVDDLA